MVMAKAGKHERKTGVVLVAGTGSMHTRFVMGSRELFSGIEWVWTDAGASCWEVENDRAREIRKELEGAGVKRFEEVRDSGELKGIMVLTGDGSCRMEEYARWSEYGVPLYLDKPISVTIEGLEALCREEKTRGIPWMTGSSWRFSSGWRETAQDIKERGDDFVLEGPWMERGGRAGWCWYGVHGLELLCDALGPDITEISVRKDGLLRYAECRFSDGRMGTFVGNTEGGGNIRISYRRGGEFVRQEMTDSGESRYRGLLNAVLGFFDTGRGWIPKEEVRALSWMLHYGWISETAERKIKANEWEKPR